MSSNHPKIANTEKARGFRAFFVACLLTGIWTIGGCSGNALWQSSLDHARSLRGDLVEERVFSESAFRILSFQTSAPANFKDPLHVFFEGDGLAWKNKYTLSRDPTPRDPVGLRIAAQFPASHKIYLARPCQYITSPACHPKYWSSHRFSQEVINSYTQILKELNSQHPNRGIILHGYSGGAAVAVLLADLLRSEMPHLPLRGIATYAGILDTEAWAQYHQVSPLTGSLNPRQALLNLRDMPQTHSCGLRDDVAPCSLAERALKEAGIPKESLIPLPYSHTRGWGERERVERSR